jgi:hypothetical protein
MRKLALGLTAVVVGAVLGLAIALTSALLEWAFSLISPSLISSTPLFGLNVAQILVAIFAIGMVVFLCLSLARLAREPRPAQLAVETARVTRKTLEGMKVLQDIEVSSDGRYAFVALHIEDKDWGPQHPFYAEGTLWTTAGIQEKGLCYYIVLRNDAGAMVPVAMPKEGAVPLQLSIVMETKGGDFVTIAFWKSLHSLMAEAGVPYLTPILTALCVFVLKLSRDKIAEQFRLYARSSLFPYLKGSSTANAPMVLAEPPKGLAFRSLEISFTAGGPAVKFRESLRKVDTARIGDLASSVANTFAPFATATNARLAFPLDD